MSYADSHDHYGYATTSDLDDLRRQLDALQASINGLEGAFQALEGEVRELTASRPHMDQLAPLHVSEHGRGFWAVLDPLRDGEDSRVGFMPEGPGLAALESRELVEMVAELLTRYDPAWRPSAPDLPGPFDPARDHLVVIFEDGAAYLYRLDGHPNQTRPLLTVAALGHGA